MMMKVHAAKLIVLLSLGLLAAAQAGQISEFEKKGGEKRGKSKSEKKKKSGSKSDYRGGSTYYPSRYHGDPYLHSEHDAGFLAGFMAWMISSPMGYRHDDPARREERSDDGWGNPVRPLNLTHETGAPTLPILRFDYNRQYVDSNLDADDFRVEAGYKMLAFHGRHTHYTEGADELDLNQFYGVLRLGGEIRTGLADSWRWEVGLGMGGVQQAGEAHHSSAALTFPIKLYPNEWLGLEFRPAWYKPQERTIADLDVSVSFGLRYIQLRGGYRGLRMQGQGTFFEGPYAGVSLSF